MRALVTGGTGFVGGHLVRHLLAAGHEVHVITRPESDPDRVLALEPATVHCQVGGVESLIEIVESARPDVVFHLAALFVAEHTARDVGPLIDSNLRFSAELVEAMLQNDVHHLIHTGTAWQHFRDSAYDPVSLYAATKQAFETLLVFHLRTAPLRVIHLKLFDTYGEGDHRPKLMPLLLHLTQGEGGSIDFSPGEQRLDLVHVDDVVRAYAIAAERVTTLPAGSSEEFAVRSGETPTLRELVRIFEKESGVALDLRFGERPYRKREVMVPWRGGATIPGWKPEVTLRDGIRRWIEHDVRG